jgi:hypothetical protein
LLSKIMTAAGIDLAHMAQRTGVDVAAHLDRVIAERPLLSQPCNACVPDAHIPDHARYCAKCGRKLEETLICFVRAWTPASPLLPRFPWTWKFRYQHRV